MNRSINRQIDILSHIYTDIIVHLDDEVYQLVLPHLLEVDVSHKEADVVALQCR